MSAVTEIARLVVRLVGDSTSYMKMLREAESAATRSADKIQAIGRNMRNVGGALSIGVTLPLAAMGKAATKAFSDFDQAMTETFAKMGKQAPQVRKEMEDLAKSLSVSGEVKYDPTQLARGYEELASAGLDAGRSMKALPEFAKFAQAGVFGIDVAVKQLTGSIASFRGGLPKDAEKFTADVQRFSDVIVGVANETTTGVEEVARAMSADAAVAAKEYGMELETLGAILGVYAMQNKDAEEAGNLMGRATRLMTASFVENKKEWQELGINIVDKATGKWIHFADAIGEIEKAFEGLVGENRTEALKKLGFDTLAQKSILPLIGQSKELRRQEEIYRKVGTTAEMAKTQMESFSSQMQVVKNRVSVAAIEIGEKLAPYVKQLGEYVSQATKAWQGLDAGTQAVILKIAMVAAVIGPLLAGMGLLFLVIGKVVAGFAALLGGITLVTGAIGIFPAAVLAVALGAVVKVVAELVIENMKLNAQLAESKRLSDELMAAHGKRNEGVIKEAAGMEGPNRQEFLAEQIALAEEEFNSTRIAHDRAKKQFGQVAKEVLPRSMTGYIWQMITGTPDLDAAKAEFDDANAMMIKAKERVDKLKEELGKAPVDKAAKEAAKAEVDAEAKPHVDPEVVKAQKEMADKVEATTKQLKEQYAMLGMTSQEAEIYKLVLNGATEAQVDEARAIAEKIKLREKEIEEEKSAAEAVAQKQKDLMDKGKTLAESLATPQEKLAAKQKELDELLAAGAISFDIYTRAVKDARGELEKIARVKSGDESAWGMAELRKAQVRGDAESAPDLIRSLQNPVNEVARRSARISVDETRRDPFFQKDRIARMKEQGLSTGAMPKTEDLLRQSVDLLKRIADKDPVEVIGAGLA